MNRIYFDNAASTPLLPEVIEAIQQTLKDHYGNPSSIHQEGRSGRVIIEQARKTIAEGINASIGEIFFTSGGSESNNTALLRSVDDLDIQRIISYNLEHPCVLNTLTYLSSKGVQIDMVDIERNGRINLDHLRELLTQNEKKTMVSLMHVNNELGIVNPLAKIADLCKEHQAILHSDTVQSVGYYELDVQATPISFMSASAHKFHGPKGIGFLYINSENQINPLIRGGSQERNMRAGTENVAYIAGMAKAFELAKAEMKERRSHIEKLKSYFIKELKLKAPEIEILNENATDIHYKIVNIRLPESEKSELALFNLDIAGIAVSGGSACSSGAEKASHVFRTLFPDSNQKLLRISFSHLNTLTEVEEVIKVLGSIF